MALANDCRLALSDQGRTHLPDAGETRSTRHAGGGFGCPERARSIRPLPSYSRLAASPLDLEARRTRHIGQPRRFRSAAPSAPSPTTPGGLGVVPYSCQRSRASPPPNCCTRQSGALDLPGSATGQRRRRRTATMLADDAENARCPSMLRSARYKNASPQLERTISFALPVSHFGGLAALLVRRRCVGQRRQEPYRSPPRFTRTFQGVLAPPPRRLCDLPQRKLLRLLRIGSRSAYSRAALPSIIVNVFGALLPLPVVPALHFRNFVCHLSTAFDALAFGRASGVRVPVAALCPRGWDEAPASPRWPYLHVGGDRVRASDRVVMAA